MMYEAGDLLKFSPFEFKNGNQPKPKYFIVLAHIDKKVMMATLPTSKDHVPADVVVKSGCVDIKERGVNAYVFSPNDKVTATFSFPRQTFVYGEQVDEYETKYLDEMDSSVDYLGKIESHVFHDLKDCIKKAQMLRRKYRNLL